MDEHICGLHNLLNLIVSCSNTVQFTFCSSTASVLGVDPSNVIEERISSNPSHAGQIGYSRSKWVAEVICDTAAKKLPGAVKILRIGQLTGDTENGVWNISEAWPLMLTTVDALGCLPRITEPLNWLPLDTAAAAVVDIAFECAQSEAGSQVYHLVNNSTETTWLDLLGWVGEIRPTTFDIVSPTVWLDRLENFPKKHPAKNLLGLWRNAYENDSEERKPYLQGRETVFATIQAQKMSAAMQNVPPVDHVLVDKIWYWLEDEIRLAKAQVYVSRNRFATV